jgi:hypothetical protein
MSWAVAANAVSRDFQRYAAVIPLVALPPLGTRIFVENVATGMETMLAMALIAAYTGVVLLWLRGRVRTVGCSLVGILAVLVRPEAGLVVVLLPVAAFLLLQRQRKPGDLLLMLGEFGAGVLLLAAWAHSYFGTPVPLAFYVKAYHSYQGYAHSWQPVTSLAAFLSGCGLYLAAIALWARRATQRMLLVFAIPLFAICGYLLTITQIMGFGARYYLPYLPLVVIPSLLTLDAAMVANSDAWGRGRVLRFGMLGLTLYIVQQAYPTTLLVRLDRAVEGQRSVYDEPERKVRHNVLCQRCPGRTESPGWETTCSDVFLPM